MVKVWGIVLVLLICLFILRYTKYNSDQLKLVDGQLVRIKGVVRQMPKIVGERTSFRVEGIWIETYENVAISYGDRVQIVGRVMSRVGRSNDSYFVLKEAKIEHVQASYQWDVMWGRWRDRLVGLWRKWLPIDEASLAVGVLLGDGGMFSTELRESFRRSGLAHIVVASGYNVTVAGTVLLGLFSWVGGRRLGIFVGALGIWGYVMLAGAGSAVVRAGIMGTIAIIGLYFGRRSDSLWSLVITGLVMLVWQPGYLTDIGWQLSIMATAGLILAGEGGVIRQTLAAFVATLPIILVNFGQMSVIGPVVNVMVVPFVPIVMTIAAVATGLGLVWSYLGQVLAIVTWPVLAYIVEIAEVSSHLPMAVWEVGEVSGLWGLGYYAIIILVYLIGQMARK
jgi:competence protein ComEC